MSFIVTITGPQNGAHFQFGQHYQVVGTIQGRPANDPPVLASVDVHGPGRVGAVQTQAKGHGNWTFAAQGVTMSAGTFVITVSVTDEDGRVVSARTSISVGLEYSPTAPAILLDVTPSWFSAFFPRLAKQLQLMLKPVAALLAADHDAYALVGPNAFVDPLPASKLDGKTSIGTERIALWILETSNPNLVAPVFVPIPPNPPDSSLPVLPAAAVAATFVPRIVPPSSLADPTDPNAPLDNLAFRLTISLPALQIIAQALLPALRAAVSRAGNSVTINSISVQCLPPNQVQTVINANAGGIGANVTITETLALVASTHLPAGPMVPNISGKAALDVPAVLPLTAVLSIINVLGGALLWLFAEPKLDEVGASLDNAVSLANAAFSGVPEVLAFGAVMPINYGGAFPGALVNWTSLATSAAGIAATGTIAVRSRTPADAYLTISGPTTLHGSPRELAGGASAVYVIHWVGITPDPATFKATIAGVESLPVPVQVDGPASSSIAVTFTFPDDPPRPGRYHFTVSVSATETSLLDASKTLTITSSLVVTVFVSQRQPPHRLEP